MYIHVTIYLIEKIFILKYNILLSKAIFHILFNEPVSSSKNVATIKINKK